MNTHEEPTVNEDMKTLIASTVPDNNSPGTRVEGLGAPERDDSIALYISIPFIILVLIIVSSVLGFKIRKQQRQVASRKPINEKVNRTVQGRHENPTYMLDSAQSNEQPQDIMTNVASIMPTMEENEYDVPKSHALNNSGHFQHYDHLPIRTSHQKGSNYNSLGKILVNEDTPVTSVEAAYNFYDSADRSQKCVTQVYIDESENNKTWPPNKDGDTQAEVLNDELALYVNVDNDAGIIETDNCVDSKKHYTSEDNCYYNM